MVQQIAPGALAFAASYIAVLVLLGVFLTIRVILVRRTKLIGLGDGGDKELTRRIRAHGNYCETAPLVMVLLLVLALVGAKEWVIHMVGLTGLTGRILHAIGLNKTAGSSPGRVGGMVLTFTSLIIGAVALLVFAWR